MVTTQGPGQEDSCVPANATSPSWCWGAVAWPLTFCCCQSPTDKQITKRKQGETKRPRSPTDQIELIRDGQLALESSHISDKFTHLTIRPFIQQFLLSLSKTMYKPEKGSRLEVNSIEGWIICEIFSSRLWLSMMFFFQFRFFLQLYLNLELKRKYYLCICPTT